MNGVKPIKIGKEEHESTPRVGNENSYFFNWPLSLSFSFLIADQPTLIS